MSAGVYVGPSTTRLESASAVGSPHERCEMGLLAPSGMAPDIVPLVRATCRPREVVIVDGVALRDEFLVPPAAAIVAPPNLSAHQPAGNAASRHDDPP